MSSDNHTEWNRVVSDHQADLMLTFNVSNGQLVVGWPQYWIDYCTEGGGAVISSPTAKRLVGDTPVYMCIPRPGHNLSEVRGALLDASIARSDNDTGYFGVWNTISSGSPAALLPAQMGPWWWLPLLASLAMAAVC